MILGATAIRALLWSGVGLHGPLIGRVATASVLAATADNLPAAAAVHAAGAVSRWAAVLGLAIGPNLFLTGSLATVICRRSMRDAGVDLPWRRFSLAGLALVPLQLAAASLGLGVTGAL